MRHSDETLDMFPEDAEADAASRIRKVRALDSRAHSDSCCCDTGSENQVQQQFRDEVDINTIIRRFAGAGQAPPAELGGLYVDLTGVTDFESAQAALDRAYQSFNSLPAQVRERFGNEPGRVLELAQSMDLEQLALELGVTPVEVPPVVPPVVAPSEGAS